MQYPESDSLIVNLTKGVNNGTNYDTWWKYLNISNTLSINTDESKQMMWDSKSSTLPFMFNEISSSEWKQNNDLFTNTSLVDNSILSTSLQQFITSSKGHEQDAYFSHMLPTVNGLLVGTKLVDTSPSHLPVTFTHPTFQSFNSDDWTKFSNSYFTSDWSKMYSYSFDSLFDIHKLSETSFAFTLNLSSNIPLSFFQINYYDSNSKIVANSPQIHVNLPTYNSELNKWGSDSVIQQKNSYVRQQTAIADANYNYTYYNGAFFSFSCIYNDTSEYHFYNLMLSNDLYNTIFTNVNLNGLNAGFKSYTQYDKLIKR